MNNIDKFFGYSIFGFVIFISSFLLIWLTTYWLRFNVGIGAIIGLVIAFIFTFYLSKRIIKKMYKLDYFFLAFIYILSSFFMFGFFMGVPVFNITLGYIAGLYIGRRVKINNIKDQSIIKKANYFCLLVLFIVCTSSAFIALNDSYTSANLEGMLKLSFKVTNDMLFALVIGGGLLLLAIQYGLFKVGIINSKKIFGRTLS